MWGEATPDERRRLVAPVVERVFVDVETKRISGLVPMPGFRTLLGAGIQKTADHAAVLLPPEYSPAGEMLELVETGEDQPPVTVTRHPVPNSSPSRSLARCRLTCPPDSL